MQVFCRKAIESDCEFLKLLEQEARANLDHFRGGSRLAEEVRVVGDNWPKQILEASTVVLVAGVDSVVMGFIIARRGVSDSRKFSTIEQVFVTHDARNIGIGDALVAAIIAWARSEAMVALDALALPGDRETKNLFERSGLVARLIVATTDLSN